LRADLLDLGLFAHGALCYDHCQFHCDALFDAARLQFVAMTGHLALIDAAPIGAPGLNGKGIP
jgi:hypothetical protein